MKFAHEVDLDHQKGEIRIDGTRFPYYVTPKIDIEPGDYRGAPAVVTLRLYADNVMLVSRAGKASHVYSCERETDLAWARERAKEIVRDGLADVIRFIETGVPR